MVKILRCLSIQKKMFSFVLFSTLSGFTLQAQNNQLVILSGANWVMSGAHLVLNNTDLLLNGPLDASLGTVWITGSNNTSLSGSSALSAQTLNLNTSSASTLTLNHSLQISSVLNFQNGLIDLNHQNISLFGSAMLQSESETSHLTGALGGSVNASEANVNNPEQLNIGNLGAVLTSPANLGIVSITRSHAPIVNPSNNTLQGIQRTYFIQPQINTALQATLRFYYLDEELNGNNAATLSLWKSNDGINWNQIGADSWNRSEKYVEKKGLADLSYWTLTDNSNPLPITLSSFSAVCKGSYALVQWQTAMEADIDHFVIQKSNDANAWTDLDNVLAKNNSNGSSYSYEDPAPQTVSYYRLKIVDISGRATYSPVFKGGCSDITLPFTVYPNPAQSQAVAQISVRQAQSAAIQLFSLDGRLVYSSPWQLQAGVSQIIIPVSLFSSGTYLVKLNMENSTLQTKLIKE